MIDAVKMISATIKVANITSDMRMIDRAAGMIVMAYTLKAIGENDLHELNRQMLKCKLFCKGGTE